MKAYEKVKLTENCLIIYFRIGIPLISDRDVCVKVIVTKISDHQRFSQTFSFDYDQFPLAKKVVRVYTASHELLSEDPANPGVLRI